MWNGGIFLYVTRSIRLFYIYYKIIIRVSIYTYVEVFHIDYISIRYRKIWGKIMNILEKFLFFTGIIY